MAPPEPAGAAAVTKEPRIFASKLKEKGSRCCVVLCNNRWGKDKELGVKRSYHSFPADPKRLQQWVKAIPRTDWVPNKSSKICSDHFTGGKKTDKYGSAGYIPSIFPTKRQPKKRTTKAAKSAGYAEAVLPDSPAKNALPCDHVEGPHTIPTPQLGQHDYIIGKCCTIPCSPEVQALQERIKALEEENEQLKSKAKRLISIENLKDSDKDFQKYTNLPNYAIFKSIADYLYKRCDGNLRHWRGADTDNHKPYNETMSAKPGRARKWTFEEDFFLALVILKTGRFHYDLAREFGTNESYVSRTFTTWINFLDAELKDLFELKVNQDDLYYVPPCFHEYDSLNLVIDCTELITQRASNLQARKETYSNYKNRDTIKFLVGLSPNMTVNYVSKAFGGRASDKFITLSSENLMEFLPPGSSVMADRGFLVKQEFSDLGVELIMPSFKGSQRSQMTSEECSSSEHIASARIHIERIIQRIRTFHILDSTIRLAQKDVVEQIFVVCAYLANYQMPIKARESKTKQEVISEPGVSVIELIEKD